MYGDIVLIVGVTSAHIIVVILWQMLSCIANYMAADVAVNSSISNQ